MLFIDTNDIRKVTSIRDAIESNREAFAIQARGEAEFIMKTTFHVKDRGLSAFMPGYVSSLPLVGLKIVSVFSANIEKNLPVVGATVILLDPETGLASAMIDGTEVTRMRAGAVSGLATELLANEDAQVGALFGTGGQASAQLEAMLAVRKLREVRIYDTLPERIKPFIERVSGIAEKTDTRLVEAPSSDAAIDEADIISTVTTTTDPAFDGARVKAGAHVNGVGSYVPHKRELDSTIICRASRVFVDNMEAVMAEAGDILIPMSEGRFRKEDIAGELGDLIIGKVPGRGSKEEITVMKTVGFVTLDIVFAHKVYCRAIERGVGRQL